MTGFAQHVVVAPDKFKGSLTAAEAAAQIAGGISAAAPGTKVSVIPVADGGEGTVLAAAAAGFDLVPVPARGPFGQSVTGWLAVRDTVAVVEAAQVSGLQLIPPDGRQPLTASSYGTGQLIGAAADLGCREVILGLGGVACTDGGAGLAQGLGALLLDDRGHLLPPGGGALPRLCQLDLEPLRTRVAGITFTAALDVDNPLLGPQGTAAVYGPQKGATPGDVAVLEGALTHWADIVSSTTGTDLRAVPGAGAAGGLGFGVLSLLNATARPGIELLLDLLGFAAALEDATLVVTGEGCLDQQTLHGKAPAGVLAAATAAGVPVAAVAGRLDLTAQQWRATGFAAAYALTRLAPEGTDPIAAAADLAEQAGALIAADFLRSAGLGVERDRLDQRALGGAARRDDRERIGQRHAAEHCRPVERKPRHRAAGEGRRHQPDVRRVAGQRRASGEQQGCGPVVPAQVTEQRQGQRGQARDRCERVAGQSHEPAGLPSGAARELREQHRVTGADGDRVHQEARALLREEAAKQVGGADRGAARGDNHVRLAVAQLPAQGSGIV